MNVIISGIETARNVYTIGIDQHLVVHSKRDMQYFKRATLGQNVLMGRRTFDSIGHSLPNRTNYVLTREPQAFGQREYTGCQVLNSISDSLIIPDLVCIGGADIIN